MKISKNIYGPDAHEEDLPLEQVVEQNEQKIINLIYGMTGDYHLAQDLAQDLAQETFLKAFQAKHTFQGKAKISTWLYRIAVNTTIDYQRKLTSRKEEPVQELDNCTTSSSSEPDQVCQKNAIKQVLFTAIAQLPEQQKEVYVLREINGCSTKEVAEILGCSGELVKWRLHKAKLALRKLLKGTKYHNTGTFDLNAYGIE